MIIKQKETKKKEGHNTCPSFYLGKRGKMQVKDGAYYRSGESVDPLCEECMLTQENEDYFFWEAIEESWGEECAVCHAPIATFRKSI